MSDYRQPFASDFHANMLPTLNGRLAQMPCLLSERFDTERVPLPFPGISAAYAFGPDWGVYNPAAVAGFAFVDGVEKCGVLGVTSPDGLGGTALVGALRPWPKVKDQAALIAAGKQLQWVLFARVGMYLWQGVGPAPAQPFGGLLVSSTDLLAGDGVSLLAGTAQGEVAFAAEFTNGTTAGAGPSTQPVVGASITVRWNVTYDPGLDVTFYAPFMSGDGIGFTAPTANVTGPNVPAVVPLKGLPKVLGLAGLVLGGNDPSVDQTSFRMDYVHVFGSSADAFTAVGPAIAEGGQNFTF